jgi:hypothetical protein
MLCAERRDEDFFKENDHCLSILVFSYPHMSEQLPSTLAVGGYYTLKSEGQLGAMHSFEENHEDRWRSKLRDKTTHCKSRLLGCGRYDQTTTRRHHIPPLALTDASSVSNKYSTKMSQRL